MEKSIGEIHNFLDGIPSGRGRRQPFFKRTRKILGIPVIPLFAVAVGAILITVLLTTYHVNIFGTINITGTPQETLLIYDTTPLIAETTPITVMDFTTLNPGDDLIATHTVSNLDGYDWTICFDLSHMPCQETDPTALWYGVWIQVENHDTHEAITSIDLPSGATAIFDYSYSINILFAEPIIDFPFDLRLTITQDEQTPPPDPTVLVVYPNGGEILNENTLVTFLYNAVAYPIGSTVTIGMSVQENGQYVELIANAPITGSYEWLVPPLTQDYHDKIVVKIYDSTATLLCQDESDNWFVIHNVN